MFTGSPCNTGSLPTTLRISSWRCGGIFPSQRSISSCGMDVRRLASPLQRRLRPVTHSLPDDIYDEATRRYGIEHAKALREQARAGGLRFEAYIPPALAEWLLDQVERGVFGDPGEAVFVMLT